MENIMDTLITDRTQADVDRAKYLNSLWDPRALQWRGTPQERAEWEAGPRGAYGFADMNRVTQAAAYLIGQLEELGYSVDIEDVTPAYNIRVSIDPAGGGVASGGGAYYEGDTATVTAQPSEKYDFAGWKENGRVVSDSASYSFTVTGPRNLTAAFALKKFQVTASVDPPGAGEVIGAGTYDIDTEVTVAATAGDGYVFSRWTEGGETVSEGPQYTFTLDRDRSLSAVMTKTYVISVTANDTDGGTVSGSGTYLDGQTVTVAAVAGDGYEFAGWSEGGTTVSADAVYTFQAAADRELVAEFVKTYVITLVVDPAGSGTASGGGTFRVGSEVSITATAGDGYRFSSWQSGGEQISTSNPYTLTVSGDQTLTALFEEIPVYTITATIDPEGSGTVGGTGQYQEGETVTLVATPSEGYKFSGWQEGGQTVSTETTYTFTATSDRALVALLEAESFTLLEYAETSGVRCEIDTGIKVTFLSSRIVLDVMPISFNSAYNNYIFIVPGWMGLYTKNGSSYSFWTSSPSNAASFSKSITNQRSTIEFDGNNKKLKIGNSSYSILSGVTNTSLSSDTVHIFTAGNCPSKIRIYSAKIYVGEDLVGDIAPAQNSDGEVGLYNKVNHEFYKNKDNDYFPLSPGPAV